MKSIVDYTNKLKDYFASNTALTNTNTALTNISITGTTNNTGATITKSTYFFLNNAMVKASADIANGATLTANTNYVNVTDGGLNDITKAATNNVAIVNVDLTTYTSSSNYYVAPCDGYVSCKGSSSAFGAMSIYGGNIELDAPQGEWNSVFVKKGAKIYCIQNVQSASFKAFW